MSSPANYYMISNRKYDQQSNTFLTEVGADLSFLQAPVSNPTDFAIVSKADWLASLQNDLLGGGQPPTAYAGLFVHGYGVSFEAATTHVYPTYFGNLTNTPPSGYPGVLIGFDWPSNGGLTEQDFNTAMERADITAAVSFPELFKVLEAIKAGCPVKVSLSAICHSMGNYAMYKGAHVFAPQNGSAPFFDQVLCVAAMLDANAFNSPSSATYCVDIANAADGVTVYYSSHDDVLPFAKNWLGYPQLGMVGPTYDNTLLPKVIGLDCSQVVDQANLSYEPPGIKLTHTAYFYIPEVREDLWTALVGESAGDREPISGTNVGFTMIPNPAGWPPSPETGAEQKQASPDSL
ncbi:MAG TPA: alpha/beta hydrolase [Thermoanaerobaculia bacterium]|nr:alpha/beta hydrolase [Thermoanaerobaculia bacterium]